MFGKALAIRLLFTLRALLSPMSANSSYLMGECQMFSLQVAVEAEGVMGVEFKQANDRGDEIVE
jgi:hypothetical protein